MIVAYVALLALIQGITEFLPVSSSGHLVLFHAVIASPESWPQGMDKLLDIAVHAGTLLAVMLVFRQQLIQMLIGVRDHAIRAHQTPNARLLTLMILASLPVIIAGFAIAMIDIALLDHLPLMAWMTIIFGVVLILVERLPIRFHTHALEEMRLNHVIIIGLSQILALIPGVSRSGITMATARALGHDRVSAARFSMLLGIVAISGAGLIGAIKAAGTDFIPYWPIFALAVMLSFLAAWGTILLLLRFFERFSLVPFGIYRILLGGVILGFLYWG